jgi:hypothetical protein
MRCSKAIALSLLLLLHLPEGAAAADPPRLRLRATLVRLPQASPCEARSLVRVVATYRVGRVLEGRHAAQSVLVVHRCPELARGGARLGKGTAGPMRPGQVHVLSLHPYAGSGNVLVGAPEEEEPELWEPVVTDAAEPAPEVLVLVSGGGGTNHRLSFEQDRITIGRHKACDILLSDGRVALRHLVLELREADEEPSIVARDLGSSAGTRLNGVPLRGERVLTAKDSLEVGPYLLKAAASKVSREE